MSKHYIATPENADQIYGNEYPVCLSLHAVEQLAAMWEMPTEELLNQMEEATPEQMREYGLREEV